jgi:hypothetical protein
MIQLTVLKPKPPNRTNRQSLGFLRGWTRCHIACGPDGGQVLEAAGLPGSGACPILGLSTVTSICFSKMPGERRDCVIGFQQIVTGRAWTPPQPPTPPLSGDLSHLRTCSLEKNPDQCEKLIAIANSEDPATCSDGCRRPE